MHGLEYLNSVGLMHRDIKPPNLLLCSSGEVRDVCAVKLDCASAHVMRLFCQVKITDFGIGRRLSDKRSGLSDAGDGGGDDDDDDNLASTFVGTRNYMRLEGTRASTSKVEGGCRGLFSLLTALLPLSLPLASPERLRGRHYGAGSDVWSLGLCVLEAALGEHPLQHVEGFAALIATLEVRPRRRHTLALAHYVLAHRVLRIGIPV